MYKNVLHKFIRLSVLLVLVVQRKGVAMTTAPEKVHWIAHYRKLCCFTDATGLHVGKYTHTHTPRYFLLPPTTPPATEGFPGKLNASAHASAENLQRLLCHQLFSCDHVTFIVSKERRWDWDNHPPALFSPCHHPGKWLRTDLLPQAGEKRVSKDVLLDPGHYRTILHGSMVCMVPQTCQIRQPIPIKFHRWQRSHRHCFPINSITFDSWIRYSQCFKCKSQ